MVVAVKQRYKLKSNSQLITGSVVILSVVAVKQRYKLKSNSQQAITEGLNEYSCCCKAKIQT